MARSTPARGTADADRVALGARLRQARRAAGLTLREVAGALSVSAGTWSAVENGRTRITDDRIAAAAALLRTRPEDLVESPARPGSGWRDFPPLELDPPLAGALEAFVELGYHGAGVRDIAQRAGLSVPGVYHHWASKQDLLVALLDLAVADLLVRARAARAEGDGPVERFTRLVECLVLFHTHRRDLGFIGASEMRSLEGESRARITAARQEVQRMVDDEVAEGCRRGLMGTPLPHEAARAVVTMCAALPQWWSPEGPSSPEAVAREYVDFALDVVRSGRSR
ncbi:helix-turn-helix domain-containing protein [Actinokineospora sp. PR83]|uniref:helix-turn-helix domain-containing protein n=1 Tax=Actinokineospora sp. PR83 TaxID=2884908 RepID=UPI001F432705|nr:helix-turn-helix domain-containing protein [Actinokineospora sp. PR83]MCG8918559.1 helix-turn-helix domain-containing protein [Actinokineospora sp. PR83]